MPKSKRSKLVTLSQTTKKGREHKEELVKNIRFCVDSYTSVYVFSVHNMRSNKVKEIRTQWNQSRFFLGRNKVMKIALGRDEGDEYKENLHLFAAEVIGNCGLLFTDAPREEVVKFFSTHKELEYARAGFEATELVTLPEGPLPQFSHAIEPHLRQLGLPTSLKNGVIHLEREFVICKIGDTLTPEQAKILKLMDMPLSEFSMKLKCVWDKATSKFTTLLAPVPPAAPMKH